ncbi:MAG: respiratory nitrate reductase subunit gamma [Actinomycetia bacterium]|nr:respiratory nitrate reductase subunit gamma [Actinomycetes bacterium]
MIDILAFAVWPYAALAVFVVGHVWRWRADQFGWTTRTSELMEKRILAWASPCFHVGTLLVIFGHVAGLLVPKSLTEAMGVSEAAYHAFAVGAGLVSGAVFVVGVVGLALRRFILKTRIRLVTRPGDVVLYVVLVAQVVLGMWQTIGYSTLQPGVFDYRDSVSIWFRSVFWLHPDSALMGGAPLVFQLHAVAGFAFFAVWPFSRLVHAWSIPLGYLTRPAIVYRHQGA